MYYLISLCAIVTISYGASLNRDGEAKILAYENKIDEKGNYHYSYETSNGISRQEVGFFIDDNLIVTGQYKYINDKGETVVVVYRADETGYDILSSNITVVYTSATPGAVLATLLGK